MTPGIRALCPVSPPPVSQHSWQSKGATQPPSTKSVLLFMRQAFQHICADRAEERSIFMMETEYAVAPAGLVELLHGGACADVTAT